ncbi:MAG: hypothetical protein AAF449_21980, partial [Myxococcota bacterium]
LVEMAIAVVVGAVSVVVAAKVAQVVIRQSTRGQQSSDFNTRSQLLTRQLRSDIQAAGSGSTGAIAVDDTVSPWNGGMAFIVNGKSCIPAMAGANNLPATAIGGTNVQPGSDAMMMVVPNPGLAGVTAGWNREGTQTIVLDIPPGNPVPATQPLANCATNVVYAVDHTAPNGAGRAQVFAVNAFAGNTITTVGALQFTLAPGSTVMCARVSTYWVDLQGWLHRTDLQPGGGPFIGLSPVVAVDSSQVGTDMASPGLVDLQVAYRFSSEVYVRAGLAVPAPGSIPSQWAYGGDALNIDTPGRPSLTVDLANWFEVRRARVNLLLRSVRNPEASNAGGQKNLTAREDGAIATVDRLLRAEWATTSETLTSLRYFDFHASPSVDSEPF